MPNAMKHQLDERGYCVVEGFLSPAEIGRSPQQVAVRLTRGSACACPDVRWQPVSEGIAYG